MKNEKMIENVENTENVVNVDDVRAAEKKSYADIEAAEAIGSAFDTGYEFAQDEDPVDDGEVKLALDSSRVIAELPFYRRIIPNLRTKSGGKIFNHFAYTRETVAGKVHEIFAYFDPSDAGGYGLLDMIFSVCKTAKLVVTEHCSGDGKGGSRTYFSYEIFSTNAEGSIYSCPVKLHGKSDKAYLDIVIKNENRLTE